MGSLSMHSANIFGEKDGHSPFERYQRLSTSMIHADSKKGSNLSMKTVLTVCFFSVCNPRGESAGRSSSTRPASGSIGTPTICQTS